MADVWAEIWDVIGPLADHVMRTGEPTWSEHQQLLMNRRGFVEETYFTFSYSPAIDADGVAAGLVDVATETTAQVVAQRRLTELASLGTVTFSAPRVTDVCVAATAELDRWGDDIVHADVFLRVDDLPVLISSTRPIDPAPVETSLLREAVIARERRRVKGDDTLSAAPMALPLAAEGDGPDGVIYVEPCSTLPASVEHDAFLVEGAATISHALEAAHARAVELGEQQRINETLQQAMLQPASDHPTVAARYRPAALNLAVGGDWYDVIDLDEHRRAMVVGDCVGHDLGAATAMGQLRSATRALLLEGHDPATVLERLDVFATSITGAYARAWSVPSSTAFEEQ
jgi:Stage II sporulation protein E (SpoIIE)